jgi:glucoamylase
VFSETLSSYTAGNTPWTLANVPSAGTLSSVAVSTTTATLTLTEGGSAADTTVGTMTVALATSATGIRDAAGNQASFAATAPADGAGPVPVTITDTNGTTDGKIQPGDTLVVTFSEPLKASTVPTSTTVSLTDPSTTANDTLNIVGITSGERDTGANTYISSNATSAAFAASTVALSNANKTVTITVGPTCSGTACASGLGTATVTSTLSFVAATTLTDAAGNAAAGTKTQAIRLF